MPGELFRFRRFLALSLVALGLATSVGCASSGTPSSTSPDSAPLPAAEPAPLEISDEALARADELLALGRRIEPALTSLLSSGAERQRIQLWGLEHRIKSRASLGRKIQTQMIEEGVGAREVVIDDTLRYTALIEDEPAGHYNDTVAYLLDRLEEAGFAVLEVKNYWPAGDSYSGINCILSTRLGLRWELQFHTIGSLAAKSEGHDLYEEFRLPTTPIERQREIFDRLVERWNWVEIPEGILRERSVHSREAIIRRPRP